MSTFVSYSGGEIPLSVYDIKNATLLLESFKYHLWSGDVDEPKLIVKNHQFIIEFENDYGEGSYFDNWLHDNEKFIEDTQVFHMVYEYAREEHGYVRVRNHKQEFISWDPYIPDCPPEWEDTEHPVQKESMSYKDMTISDIEAIQKRMGQS